MKYTVMRDAHGQTVRMEGRFLHKDFAQVNQLMTQLKQAGSGAVTLDMAGVEFIDSGGIGLLLLMRQQLGGAAITLRGARGQPAQLLTNAHMGELFRLSG